MQWEICYAYLQRSQQLRNEEKLVYCVQQVLLHQGIRCMFWKGIWMHKLRYFKTDDVFSIHAFFSIVFESKILSYYTVKFDSLCSRLECDELDSVEMFHLKFVTREILKLFHTKSRGAST